MAIYSKDIIDSKLNCHIYSGVENKFQEIISLNQKNLEEVGFNHG